MKNLFLLRHCEANQFEEDKSDFEKQLNENGEKEAELLKDWFDKNNIILDHILVSSAYRTLKTANIIFCSVFPKNRWVHTIHFDGCVSETRNGYESSP